MSELTVEDTIQDQIGLTQPGAFEQTTGGESVTAKHLYSDGGQGDEKEATLRSHTAGASSEAPASSGISCAQKQDRIRREAVPGESER